MPKPIWELPINFCPSTEEGRKAFRDGMDVDANPYGDSAGGVKWIAGWKAEAAKAAK